MGELDGQHARVVVGVSGSLGNLNALRRAVAEARARRRTLMPVLCWEPPGGEAAYRAAPVPELAREWEASAERRLAVAFEEAFGGYPTDLPVEPLVVRGETGYALCELADQPDDLLVVGTGRTGLVSRLFHARVAREVSRKAACEVLLVPPVELPPRRGRSARRLRPEHFSAGNQSDPAIH